MNIFEELNFSGHRRLPMLYAAESAECGLACVVMIGRYYGHDIDLNGMRQRYSLSLAGATLHNVISLAGNIGFSTRALKVDLESLRHVKTPAIIHWNLSHFVVLKSCSPNKLVIHDPAKGVVSLDYEEASKHYTGVVLEVFPASDFRPITAKAPVRISSLWSDARGLTGSVGQVLILALALQVIAFLAPFQTQLVIDEAIGRSDIDLLTVLAWGFGILLLIQAALGALRSWAMQVLGAMFSFQVTGNIVRHLLRVPATYFEKRHLGDILSRMGSSKAIQSAITEGVISAILDGGMALVAGLILFAYSTKLALVVMLTLLINLVIAFAYYPIMRLRLMEQLNSVAVEQSFLMETVRAASTIKIMGSAGSRESSWRNLYATVTNNSLLSAKYRIIVELLQGSVGGLQTIIILYLGAKAVIAGEGFSIGMLMAFISFRQTFSTRVGALINQAFQFRMLGLHLERLGDIIATPAEDNDGAIESLTPTGSLTVQDVSFKYGESDRLIMEGVNLHVPAGEFVAIVGPSGCGKSTLLKIMLGLQTPTRGEVLLGDRAGTPQLFAAWRRHVGVVVQNDQLLSGSLADNISFFDPDLDMNKVRDAAAAARIHDDILRMPMQYLSLVGDMGSTLSAGQRQRVLLARALYRKPKILFLDEGTANLDEATEASIGDLIESMTITRIIVAHRPALLKRADRIVTFDRGVLKEVEREGSSTALKGEASSPAPQPMLEH